MGKLSDRIGRKKIVIVGLLGFAISLMLFSFTISLGQKGLLTGALLFFLLIAARLLNGIFGSATRPSSGGWVADIVQLIHEAGLLLVLTLVFPWEESWVLP